MKKVIFFSVNMHIGGMEKALADLLNELSKRGYSVTLVLEQKEGELLEELDKNICIKEYRVQKNGNPLFRKCRNFIHRKYWELKNRNKYDFSCAYATYSVIGSRLALAASSNSSLYVHSNYYDVYRGSYEEIKSFFDTLFLEKFKNVIFVSDESRNRLQEVYSFLAEKGVVINNLIDVSRILSLSEERMDPVMDGTRNFLFVGRLEEESKRLTRLIEAFAIAGRKDGSLRLYIIGDGKDYELCRNMIRKEHLEHIVTLLGKKENPYPYIKNADCVLLTSDYEGYPVTYNECLILQTPLIATVPVSDGFVDIRDYARIVDKDAGAIADAILNTDLEDYGKYDIDFEGINLKKIQSLEKIINGIQEE